MCSSSSRSAEIHKSKARVHFISVQPQDEPKIRRSSHAKRTDEGYTCAKGSAIAKSGSAKRIPRPASWSISLFVLFANEELFRCHSGRAMFLYQRARFSTRWPTPWGQFCAIRDGATTTPGFSFPHAPHIAWNLIHLSRARCRCG